VPSPGAAATTAALGLAFVQPVDIAVGDAGGAAAGGARTDPVEVRGPWRLTGVVDGVRAYESPNPVRPRALFYERAPEGSSLTKGGTELAYDADPRERDHAGSWELDMHGVTVRLRPAARSPWRDRVLLRYPDARDRDDRLRPGDNPPPSIASAWRFASRSLQLDEVSRAGVYLPAPAHVTWDVELPAGARFGADLGLLPPEVDRGQPSDGADITLRVDGTNVATWRAKPGEFQPVSVPLGASGRHRLDLAVEDRDPTSDFVHVGSPTIYVPSATPRRVVLAFVDTLRRDHLGIYGYPRAVTPRLDAWAQDAAVFEDARTVAPWTLPSARAVVSGREPEAWDLATTLPRVLGARGWATGAFTGNVYLSSNFQMDADWNEHRCVNWPGAAHQVARARRFLSEHGDQDALLLLHLMDPHLPYREPAKYRGLYAGKRPPMLGALFNRNMLLRAAQRGQDLVRTYLVDRYDQNVRYVDDELGALLAELGRDAVVAFFSDHGEEFFDHGGVEHGHALHEELIRVPLVIAAPGVAGRRVDAPVSLIDVAPTVLDLAGIDPAALSPEGTTEAARAVRGVSLARLARGEPGAELEGRPRGFGRVLYGYEQWGSTRGKSKWTTTAGVERLYDLGADPGERADLRGQGKDPTAGRAALADALAREVVPALRFTPTGHSAGGARVEIVVPTGIERWWIGDDPARATYAEAEQVDATRLRVFFDSLVSENREFFVVPSGDLAAAVGQVTMRFDGVPDESPLHFVPVDGAGSELGKARRPGWTLLATWALTPLPLGVSTPGTDREQAAALEALGYSVPAEPATTTGSPASPAPRSRVPPGLPAAPGATPGR
jgi:arylsulfatase A-like enzyme